jgi:DNA-binding GntR family transcriptional regulator
MVPSSKSELVPRASLSDAVYERLRDAILEGDLEDGAPLNQVELAERYGVSRIPIREALRRLQSESLVIATPYHPFVVRKVSPAQVVELIDIRVALEDLALARREPATDEEIAQLREINRRMAEADGNEAWFPLDRELHRLVAGPNTMIVELIEEVRDRVRRYSASMMSAKAGRKAATREHTAIIDALEAHDMDEARKLMHQHTMQSREFMVKRLGKAAKEAAAKTGDG